MEHPMVNYGFNDAEEGVWYHPVIPVSELMRQIATDNGISFEYDRESVLAEIRIPLLTKTVHLNSQKNVVLFLYRMEWVLLVIQVRKYYLSKQLSVTISFQRLEEQGLVVRLLQA